MEINLEIEFFYFNLNVEKKNNNVFVRLTIALGYKNLLTLKQTVG